MKGNLPARSRENNRAAGREERKGCATKASSRSEKRQQQRGRDVGRRDGGITLLTKSICQTVELQGRGKRHSWKEDLWSRSSAGSHGEVPAVLDRTGLGGVEATGARTGPLTK